MADDAGSYRGVYGRGLFDGLRKAGVDDQENFMRELKMKDAEDHLSGLPKRILDAVPRMDAWPASKIITELRRRGANPEHPFVLRCLIDLKQQGLISEPEFGKFTRKTIERKQVMEPVKKAEPRVIAIKPAPAKPGTMDRMAGIASLARDLAKRINDLAKDIEDAALDVEERILKSESETGKLRQLQTLLKSIGQ